MSGQLEKMSAQVLAESILEVASSLRDMADRVESSANLSVEGPQSGNGYADICSGVIHVLTWGIANLNLSRLVREASQADVARSKGE